MPIFREYVSHPGAPAPNCAPGLFDRIFAPQRPYVGAPTEMMLRPAPVAGSTARDVHVLDVDILSPEIRPGAAWTENGRTVCIPVPEGAKRYFVRFSPAWSARAATSTPVPNATPFGVLEGPHGEVPAGENLLRITPVWARLTEEPVGAASIRAVLSVEFITQ